MSNNENLIRAKTQIIKSASHRINYSKSAPLRLPDLIKKKNNDKSIQRPKKTIQAKSLTAKNYTVKLPNFKDSPNRFELNTSASWRTALELIRIF